MKKRRIAMLILPLAAFVLELLPFGAVLIFAEMYGNRPASHRVGYSYFDLTLVGYANFGPFIAGMMTVAALIFAAVYGLWGKKGALLGAAAASGLGAVASIWPLVYGIDFYNIISAAITLLLAACAVLAFRTAAKKA